MVVLSRGRVPRMGVVILPGETEGTPAPCPANDEAPEPDEVFHVMFGDFPRDGSAREPGLHTKLGVASDDAVAVTIAASDPAHIGFGGPRVAPAGGVA